MDITVEVRRDYDDGPQLVRIGEQYALPARFQATITPDRADLPICHLRVVVEHGRAVCDGLALERQPEGPPVSGDALRRVPVAEYVSRAVDNAGYWLLEGQAPLTVTIEGETLPLASIPFDDQHVAVPVGGVGRTAEYKAATRAPRAQGRVTDETLREVADVYRRSHGKREPPTQAVMTEWRVSRTTASRWIRRARARGYLGAARPRFAGEYDPKQEENE